MCADDNTEVGLWMKLLRTLRVYALCTGEDGLLGFPGIKTKMILEGQYLKLPVGEGEAVKGMGGRGGPLVFAVIVLKSWRAEVKSWGGAGWRRLV